MSNQSYDKLDDRELLYSAIHPIELGDPIRDTVTEALADLGLPTEKLQEGWELVCDTLEVLRARIGAEAIHRLIWAVGGKEGAALRRAFLNSGDYSLREFAALEGVSKSTLDRRSKVLRKKLGHSALPIESTTYADTNEVI